VNRNVTSPSTVEPPPPWTVRVSAAAPGSTAAAAHPTEPPSGGVVVARHVVSADSFWGRFMGLMGRAALPEGEGLYLVGNSIHMFFMRFPIDAVFVGAPDASGARTVVGCRPNLQPWTGLVMPVKGAAAVIELVAGTLERTGIQPGTVVRFESSSESVTGPVAA
jgi:uncharacterized membrane protein (UPF0127 family)